jgi:hypothetical protein
MTAELKTAAFGEKVSPAQLLIDAMQHMEGAHMLVLVFIDKDDIICTAWSDGRVTERCGILDVAKARMIDSAKE